MKGTILDGKDFNDLPPAFSVETLAAALAIGRNKAYELANSAGFPALHIGKRIVIPRQAFINWLDSQLVAR
jgi:excisionase family DNA binding protein